MDIRKQEQKFINRMNSLPSITVPLYLNSPEDLVDSNNYSSASPVTLNDSIKEYLNKAAEEITIKNSIKIEIHFRNKGDCTIDCEKIIHDYYGSELNKLIAEHKKNSKHWRFRLLYGVIFLAACHGISLLFSSLKDSALTNLLQDSFEIMGWVAIWEPSTYLLFSRRSEGQTISDCFQLKNAKIEICQ